MVKLDFANIKLKDTFSSNAFYQKEYILRFSVRRRQQNVLDQLSGFWLLRLHPLPPLLSADHTKISQFFNSKNKVKTYLIFL